LTHAADPVTSKIQLIFRPPDASAALRQKLGNPAGSPPRLGSAAEPGALLAACAGGDRSALHRLYRDMAPQLLGIALRLLGSRPLAEEVLQDAFVQIWRNAGRFDPALGSAEAWMVGILRYRALDRREAERRHVRPGDLSLDEADDAGVLGSQPLRFGEEALTLLRCLNELNEGAKQSIVLAYLEGCSQGEIAERMGQPLGTVKSWILRGLDALRRCLDR
jgi:RNA polymerase sigma-70 factor, ECF subfamily